MQLFDYVNTLNSSEKDNWESGVSDSEYNPVMVNKAFSFSSETIMHAQEMNQRFGLDKRMQYDFYRLAVQPKRRRKTEWVKGKDDLVQFILETYNVSYKKAIAYAEVLNNDDIETIKSLLFTGGMKNAK